MLAKFTLILKIYKEEDDIGVSGPVPEYLIFNISGNYLINEKNENFHFSKKCI